MLLNQGARGQLLLTDCAVAERGVFLKDGVKLLKSVMGGSGVMDWARSCLKEKPVTKIKCF